MPTFTNDAGFLLSEDELAGSKLSSSHRGQMKKLRSVSALLRQICMKNYPNFTGVSLWKLTAEMEINVQSGTERDGL